MKISEILSKNRYSVSFEVFPPRRDAPMEPVLDTVKHLAGEKPSFISVTYGAGGGANANTVSLAEHVQKTCSVPALAHLTCLTSSREKIAAEIQTLLCRQDLLIQPTTQRKILTVAAEQGHGTVTMCVVKGGHQQIFIAVYDTVKGVLGEDGSDVGDRVLGYGNEKQTVLLCTVGNRLRQKSCVFEQ